MRTPAFLVVALSIAVTGSTGRTIAAQQRSEQPFRSSTRLVQVSVVVHDDRQRPLTGLRAQDFQIFEDGKELPVALFSVKSQPGGDPAALVAAPEPPGTFTNRIQSPSGGGVVAIVFDQLNTSHSDQVHARTHLLKFLGRIKPDDRVALYVLTSNGLKVLYDFTKDAQSLLNALNAVQPGGSRELAAIDDRINEALTADLSAFARGNLVNMRAFYLGLRTDTTLAALEGVAAHLGGVAGRKNLVWISSGFPFGIPGATPAGATTSHMTSETRRATRALNNSDIAAYPVDARGLITSSPENPLRPATLAAVQGPIEGLRIAADWTGGRAFFNTNDIGAAIARAVDDSRLTYMLGYYPLNDGWDGRFRAIKVKVRRPGVEVRHRSGYYAIPPLEQDKNARQKAVIAAVEHPLEATALPLTVRARLEAGKIALAIELEPGSIGFTKRDGRWSGELDIAIAQTVEDNRHVRDAEITLPFSLTDQTRQRLVTDGVRLTRTIDLRSGARQIRIAVRDVETGVTGAVFIDAEALRRRAEIKSF